MMPHMKTITLGSTGITTPQNAFGALPVQRVNMEGAVELLQKAWQGGMTFFDTARAYSDSEEKLGQAFGKGGFDTPASRALNHRVHCDVIAGNAFLKNWIPFYFFDCCIFREDFCSYSNCTVGSIQSC